MKENYDYLDSKLTIDLMKVPTYSKMEFRLTAFIIRWCGENNVDYEFDEYGNLYLTKGEISDNDGFYPCVTAHLDSVQKGHKNLITSGELIKLLERTNKEGQTELYANGMGLGADDKCGVLVSLCMFKYLDVLKAVFFLEEEIGCLGSENLNVEWFNNVGYVIGFDSPDRNRAAWACSRTKLFDKEFFENHIKDVCERNGVTKFYSEPFTDVKEIRNKVPIQCMNFGSAHYNAHSNTEYVVVEELDEVVKLGIELVQHLGNKRYTLEIGNNTGYSYQSLYNDPDYEFMSNLGDNNWKSKYANFYGNGNQVAYGYSDDYYDDFYSNMYGYGQDDEVDVDNLSPDDEAEYWKLQVMTRKQLVKKVMDDKETYEETIRYIIEKNQEAYDTLKDKIASRCEILGIDFESEFQNCFDDGLPF